MSVIVPPGGFAGLAQMTPASRAAWGSAGRGGTRKRRRKSGKRAAAAGGRRRAGGARKKSSVRKPKFGSPAWRKKYMKGRKKRGTGDKSYK